MQLAYFAIFDAAGIGTGVAKLRVYCWCAASAE
jgi:hypothetical protein